jgi:hypothetical protein
VRYVGKKYLVVFPDMLLDGATGAADTPETQ